MSEEIKSEQQEEDIYRKARSKKRIRGLLIAINVILGSYFIFELARKISDYAFAASNNNSDIILIGNKSSEQSMKIYDKYISKVDGEYEISDVYDYGVYGHYLHLSTSYISPDNYSSFTTIAVRNISLSEVQYTSSMNTPIYGEYLNGGLDLSSLNKGDYILHDAYLTADNYSSAPAIKIADDKKIEETIYTLPNANDVRKKIVIKNYPSSPCMVISVSEVSKISNDYYDYVFMGSDEDVNKVKQILPANNKVLHAKSLKEAFLAQSNYCFIIESREDILVSSHINLKETDFSKDELYGKDIIANEDKNIYIRELGGSLTSAGSCLEDDLNTKIVKPYVDNTCKGKLVAVIDSNINYEQINKITSL